MKWLREPLAHFLLIGAALFGIFAIWGGPVLPAAGQYHIVITPTMVQNLALTFQNTEKRPPSAKELDAQIDDYVHEEILNREARAINLDQDDPVVRKELRGKMGFILQDSAIIPAPTDAQLSDFLQKNAAEFRQPNGSLPALADVREKVVIEWENEQRRETANAAYEKLRAHYVVDVQMPTAAATAAANSTVK